MSSHRARFDFIYKMAKEDGNFHEEYNKIASKEIKFKRFPDYIEKGVVAAYYEGYLLGKSDGDKLNFIKEAFGC